RLQRLDVMTWGDLGEVERQQAVTRLLRSTVGERDPGEPDLHPGPLLAGRLVAEAQVVGGGSEPCGEHPEGGVRRCAATSLDQRHVARGEVLTRERRLGEALPDALCTHARCDGCHR